MEIAIVLGSHPSWCMGARFIGPYGTDERHVMGGLMGEAQVVIITRGYDTYLGRDPTKE
ncbi:MAG: UbiD family decarboxylase [Deltaproteobacteria bacterium]|nr:UbiD family decarboxylase [Deltaproteobacteria bacterium]